MFSLLFGNKNDNQILCPYCATGCTFKYKNEKIVPKNGACVKGLKQFDTIKNLNQVPMYRKDKTLEYTPIEYKQAIKLIAEKLKETPKEKIAVYSAGQILIEDYYVINKFFKGFIGTPHVDSNSRTCVASAATGLTKALGMDFVPGDMEDLLSTDLILIWGGNPAKAHPVLFQNYIKKAKKNGAKIAVIDPRKSATAEIADLWIPIAPEKDVYLINSLIKRIIMENRHNANFIKRHTKNAKEYLKWIADLDFEKEFKKSEIDKSLFNTLYDLIVNSSKTVSLWGMGFNQSSNGTLKNLAVINLHTILGRMFKKGNTVLPITGQCDAMGGREVGGLSHLLAVGNPIDSTDEKTRKKIQKFWKTDTKLPDEKGCTAVEIFEHADNIEILFVIHTDPVYSLPNRTFIEQKIQKIPFVIEINSYKNTETSQYSNLILPVAPLGMRDGHMTNLDRHVKYGNKVISGFLKADWEIICDIAKECGYKKQFSYKDANEVFKEFLKMTKLSPYHDHYKFSLKKINKEGIQWGNDFRKEFLTNHKIKLNVTEVSEKQKTSALYPYKLVTFRLKNLWNSNIRTQITENTDVNFVIISPEIADRENLDNGDIVKIQSIYGELSGLRIMISEQNPDTVAIPIHHRGVNYLTPLLYDKYSKEPEYNNTPIRIIKEN